MIAATPDGHDQEAAPGGEALDLVAARVVHTLTARRQTVATAESITGGIVVGALTGVAGASTAVRGGICAYQADVKNELVGVAPQSLATGAINEQVAGELAAGARERLRSTWGFGTTGAAGPDPTLDAEVGTVFIAVAGPRPPGGSALGDPDPVVHVRKLSLSGDRAQIRTHTAVAVLELFLELSADRVSGAVG